MFPAARYIICHFKYAITCVYSLTSATGIWKVCTTCYWQVNIYIYKHGIICKFWKLPNLFSSPIWPELPSKYPVKSKHLVVQIWRRRMFPADRGRIWDLFLTNSSVALCICKAISSVPTRLISTINKFISMLKTMTFYLLFMLDQVTFNHLAYILMVLFGIIYNFWNVPNLTFIQLNLRQFCHLTSAVDWTFPVKIKHSAVHFWRCRMFPADRNRKWHWSIALCKVTKPEVACVGAPGLIC